MRNILIYDGDCGFCTQSVNWLTKNVAACCGPKAATWQSFTADQLASVGLTEAMVTEAAYWVTEDGALLPGARAIAKALQLRGGVGRPLSRLITFPLILPLSNAVYKKIAVNRHRMPGATAACKLPSK